jgi:hypothetical protein
MIAYMRNVQTGEIKEVIRDSDEMRSLQAEVYEQEPGRAYPKWEQTGDHHVRRMDEGDVHVPADFGYEDSDVGNVKIDPETERALAPNPHPERELTQGERDSGIESWEEKVGGFVRDVSTGQESLERGLERVGRQGDPGELRGKELDAALENAGLSKSGTVAEKRERLAESQQQPSEV